MAANVLALLIPTLISTIQETARNSGFFLNGITRDQVLDAAAKGQAVTFPSLPDIVAYDVTPGIATPDADGATAASLSLTLANQKAARFKLNAEDNRGMAALGANYRNVQISLAIAALVDALCADVNTTMDAGAGLAQGTVGTDPYATTPNVLVDMWKSLADDKAPDSGRLGIFSTDDYASASKLSQFQKLNEAPSGTDFATSRLGTLANFNVGYDQLAGPTHTAGTGAGFLVNNGAGFPVGAVAITVDTGTGTILPGDVITIAGSTTKYVVKSATATVITLNRGLLSAVADNAAVTLIATHGKSFLCHPSATYYSIRPSAEVPEGDQATMREIIVDPVTRIPMRLAYYPQYHQGMWEVSFVYGGLVRRPSWLRKVIR
jgi:hypothetical protein